MNELLQKAFNEINESLDSASLAKPKESTCSLNKPTSWFGNVNLAAVGETWPLYEERNMFPLLQIVLDELPVVPEKLKDFAVITVFIGANSEGKGVYPHYEKISENGEGWLIRAYTKDEKLEYIQCQSEFDIKPFPVVWERSDKDAPCYEDLEYILDEDTVDLKGLYELLKKEFSTYALTKVGGWPYCIQDSIDYDDDFVFQIGSEDEANWMWGDDGCAYVSLSDEGEWYFEWQSY